MSFDLERSMARARAEGAAERPHVFVTGMARAGTTILLRTIYRSGSFACQTYRDMPFVLAPQLWRRLSAGWRKAGESKERAHADGLLVDFDSVEAFEEVFWLTFAGDLYVRDDHLRAHLVDEELAALFRDFIAVVIAAQGGEEPTRYLSKNNNNILRLKGLARALPSAQIIVPFRAPVQQAHSLLRQHRIFSDAQTTDPFTRKYMRWLGHFEFGCDHRPFTFGDGEQKTTVRDTNCLHYWLEYWTKVHQMILASLPDNAILWDYDAFCREPLPMITALAEHLDLEGDPLRAAVGEISQRPGLSEDGALPAAELAQARATHSELRRRSMEKLR